MLNVAGFQQVARAIFTPERTPASILVQLRIPLVLLLSLPVLDAASLGAKREAEALHLLAMLKEVLGPSTRTTAKIQEGRAARHALQQPDSSRELCQLVSCSILVLLATDATVRKKLRPGYSAHQAACERWWWHAPKGVQATLRVPQLLHEVGPARRIAQQLLLLGHVHARLAVQRQHGARRKREAEGRFLERRLRIQALWNRRPSQGVEVGLQAFGADTDFALDPVAPGHEETHVRLLSLLRSMLLCVPPDLDAHTVHNCRTLLHASLQNRPASQQHHCAALRAFLD
mmetsp:Transcript_55283/g.140199  ORF Transcript_55283/g.140199 Transcript_55283/m.140199 type:complete len:288 (-) Transcript_55283:313-1176(-)